MSALGVSALLLALLASCQGYNSFRSSYRTSSSSPFGNGQPQSQPTIQLSTWGEIHKNEVREFASHLNEEYYAMSSGGSNNLGHSFNWSQNIQRLSGKSASELDALCFHTSQKLVNDMRQGLLSYSNIVQPMFFDAKAEEVLQRYASGEGGSGQQPVDLNPYHPVDLSSFDAGQVTHGYYAQKPMSPTSVTSTVAQTENLQNWIQQQTEPRVMGYRSIVDDSRGAAFNAPSYSPIGAVPNLNPVSYPADNVGQVTHGYYAQKPMSPTSVTSILTQRENLQNRMDGSRWVDGKLVYDNQQCSGLSLDDRIRRNNEEIVRLQKSIRQTQGLRGEARIGDLIKEQNEQVTRLSTWQSSERARLESMLKEHRGSLTGLQQQMAQDRNYIQNLAAQYRVGVDELENWQRQELQRMYEHSLGPSHQTQIPSTSIPDSSSLIADNAQEQQRLDDLIRQHNETIVQLQNSMRTGQQRLKDLSIKYQGDMQSQTQWLRGEVARIGGGHGEEPRNVYIPLNYQSKTNSAQVAEIDQSIKSQGDRLQREGQLQMETELNNWQRIERQRLLDLINKNGLSIEELETEISRDQAHLYSLANQHHVRVEEIEQWIQQQIEKLKKDGHLEMQRLQNWQQLNNSQLAERQQISKPVQQKNYSTDEYERKILEFDWNANYNDGGQQQPKLLDNQQQHDLGQVQVEDLTGQGYGSHYGQMRQAPDANQHFWYN